MAQYNQVARHGGYIDITCKNLQGTDIAAKAVVIFDSTATDAPAVKLAAAAGTTIGTYGVAVDTIKAGSSGRVCILGPAIGVASGSIAGGDIVLMDTTSGKVGRVKTAADAVAHVGATLGKALCAAADGDDIEVLVAPAACTTA